jgi:hypothetical protein
MSYKKKRLMLYYSALGSGMMVLGRYLEYVQIKAVNLPQLLIPSINEARAALGLPPLGEGYFLDVPYLPDSQYCRTIGH